MKYMAIVLSLLGAVTTCPAADSPLIGRGTAGLTNPPPENPLVGRGIAGVTNRGEVGSQFDPRIGRGPRGVVTNQFGTNVPPGLTNGIGQTNLSRAPNEFRSTNAPGGVGQPLTPGNPIVSPPGTPLPTPGQPAVPSRPLPPGNPVLPPPGNPATPGSPVAPPKP